MLTAMASAHKVRRVATFRFFKELKVSLVRLTQIGDQGRSCQTVMELLPFYFDKRGKHENYTFCPCGTLPISPFAAIIMVWRNKNG